MSMTADIIVNVYYMYMFLEVSLEEVGGNCIMYNCTVNSWRV